jgi:uncharacterized integral membrane protein
MVIRRARGDTRSLTLCPARYDHREAMSAPSAQIPPGPGAKAKHERRPMRERLLAAGPLILAAIFIAFAVLNLNQVKVDWIVGSGHAPLIIVIVISVLVGIVLTHFAERVGRRRR